jgi:ABC-2 type transport system permease protein|nr:ABC-2 transporter permease [uncultured Acetatifactor sp.]
MRAFLKMAKLDFLTMKTQFFSYLSLVVIVLMFGFMKSSVIVLCITSAWFIALQASNIFAIQEKNNLERLYGSVSVELNDIVLGRYAFMFLNYFISFLAVIVLNFGFSLYQGITVNVSDIMLGFSLSFLIFSIITGIQMPLFFKMGYTKAKVWALLPFLIVMAVVVIPSFITALSDLIQSIMVNQCAVIIISIMAGCVIEFMSYKIAVIAYRKRK